jgi:hypothetical protein
MGNDDEKQAYVTSNGKLARELFIYLEDRRILHARHGLENAAHCVSSAIEIRKMLTLMMNGAEDGPLLNSLRVLRASARDFVSAAGSDGVTFESSSTSFIIGLTALRIAFAREIDKISQYFSIDVPADLRRGLQDVRP